jgi:hypothetical protein
VPASSAVGSVIYCWRFLQAQVWFPILGMDFLRHFKLLIAPVAAQFIPCGHVAVSSSPQAASVGTFSSEPVQKPQAATSQSATHTKVVPQRTQPPPVVVAGPSMVAAESPGAGASTPSGAHKQQPPAAQAGPPQLGSHHVAIRAACPRSSSKDRDNSCLGTTHICQLDTERLAAAKSEF